MAALGHSSIEKDLFVSVRVGACEKLSRLSDEPKVYRFPEANGSTNGKISLVRRLGSCGVDMKAVSEGSFREVALPCKGIGELVVQVLPESGEGGRRQRLSGCQAGVDPPSASDPACASVNPIKPLTCCSDEAAPREQSSAKVQLGRPAANSASKESVVRTYIASHSLESNMAHALQEVLRERPDNPTAVLAQKLLVYSKGYDPEAVAACAAKAAGVVSRSCVIAT